MDELPEIDEDYVKLREIAEKKYLEIEKERKENGIRTRAEEDESDGRKTDKVIKFLTCNFGTSEESTQETTPEFSIPKLETPSQEIPNPDLTWIYQMNKKHMGYFLIFNQVIFTQDHEMGSTRYGSIEDAENLAEGMTQLGFVVKIYDNRKTKEIKREIERYASSTVNASVNAFGVAFLSHGDVKDKLATFDDYIYLSEIIDPIKRAKNLFQKPKIFIIQACRGTDFMNGVQLVAKRSRQCTWPVEADILCVFPTTEGHVS